MTNETQTDERDASTTNYDDEDLDDAAEQLDEDIDRQGEDIPQSRRELAKEEAADLLDASEGGGLMAADQALRQARQQSKGLNQKINQMRQTLDQMEEERRLAAAIERLLVDVRGRRAYFNDAAEDLATRDDTSDGEDE